MVDDQERSGVSDQGHCHSLGEAGGCSGVASAIGDLSNDTGRDDCPFEQDIELLGDIAGVGEACGLALLA
jgi:hypothetical protein